MWGSVHNMARAVVDGLTHGGVSTVRVMRASATERSAVMTELLTAGALVVGSPTLNNGLYPSLADILSYVKGLRPQNLIGGIFGSYGWSGGAVKDIQDAFDATGIKCPVPPVGT
eukprot:NODE_6113_length_469_cov_305.247619_g2180_i1.p1 GENE.NODE_6113_length_469_cov_305.247619_g2180_i1~~NODE_6113_length_469_cov_305.247619_g2180_i1.p1  ORF type:complete len:114 (-),score=25.28 NODE_6113_length_469_cov_305.247619_g2180_i1:35-376(-)